MKDSEVKNTQKNTEQEKATTSRRNFLKGAAITGVAAALAGTTVGAAGCSTGGTSGTANAIDGGARQSQYSPTVYESDVLVIGGGLSGLMAAKTAMAEGASVNVVDKGPWGHSGTSGINWGHDMQTAEYGTDDGTTAASTMAMIMCGMPSQTLLLDLARANMESKPNVMCEQVGMTLERNPDGTVKGTQEGIVFTLNHGCFNRYFAQNVKYSGAGVFDRTRVLDVLTSEDGSAAGAVALDVRTGEPVVFRAKKTILATGSYAWIAGDNGLYPFSMCGPENTGDGIAMLIKAGIPMRDMEQLPCDFVQWTPMGTRQGMGTLGASIVNHWMVYDKDYNRITAQWDENPMFSNAEFMQACFGAIHQGRGTENGGIYIETSTLEDPSNDRYYRSQREAESRLGYELPEFCEAVGEQWESAAWPFTVSGNCETEIPGLYYASAAPGTWNGCAYFGCTSTGYLSGKGAALTAQQLDAAPPVVWDQINAALSEAYGLLEANPSDGIRSDSLVKNVRETYWQGLSPFRNEEGIQATLDELDRIENEDLSKMVVPSKSRQLNIDWQRALDMKSLLLCAKGTGHAALARKETRGAHCRTDYPKPDNANWMVNTKTQLVDGTWTTELVDIDDSLVPKDTLVETVLEIGLEYEV